MTLQKIINTAAKYPWRYGGGQFKNDPLRKLAGVTDFDGAADELCVLESTVRAFAMWWDCCLAKDDIGSKIGAQELYRLGYSIPCGPRLIRARRKTKRVRAYQYLREQK